MKIVVETPKWSFSKFDTNNGKLEREFRSPFPAPVNYGYVKDTKAADGDGVDVVIPGPRLAQGTEIESKIIGKVKYIDSGVKDHKYIAAKDRRSEKLLVLTFASYVWFKAAVNLLRGKIEKPKFLGIEWFDAPIDNPALLPTL